MFVSQNLLFGKPFSKLSCICLTLGKLVNGKFWLGFQESVFLENLGGKHFPEVVKKLEMSYYLLIISNLVFKLLIAIYTLFWIFIFQFHLLKFNFYINFGPHFYNCYLFSLIIFLLKFCIYQIWSSFFWLLLIFLK